MGQQEILDWLEGRDWATSEKILENIDEGRKSMNRSLMSLVNHNEIHKKKDERKKNGYLYKM